MKHVLKQVYIPLRQSDIKELYISVTLSSTMLDNFNKDIFQNPTKVNQLKARKHKGVTLSTIHVYVLYIYARKKNRQLSCRYQILFV